MNILSTELLYSHQAIKTDAASPNGQRLLATACMPYQHHQHSTSGLQRTTASLQMHQGYSLMDTYSMLQTVQAQPPGSTTNSGCALPPQRRQCRRHLRSHRRIVLDQRNVCL